MTYDAPLRDAVTAELLEVRQMHGGFLPTCFVKWKAHDIGSAESTLRRWVSEALEGSASPGPAPSSGPQLLEELSDDHIDVVFQYLGDLAKAKRALDQVDPQIAEMSERTFRRRWADVHPSIRAMATDGAAGVLASQLRLIYTAEHRNQIWHVDCMECPVWVLPDANSTQFVKPWMITVEDDHSRRIMDFGITMGRPTADDVIAVLAGAIGLKPLSVEGEYAGGVPDALHTDNGAEFNNLIVTQGTTRLGIKKTFTYPYRSYMNGKVERLQQTIQDSVMKPLPGYADGPRTLSRKDTFGVDSQMLGEKQFVEIVEDGVENYNAFHQHSSLGGWTPNQVWCADGTPLRTAEPEAIRLSLLREDRKYKVHQRGVHFHGEYYIAPELGSRGLVGSKVDVRYLPRDPSFVEIFYKDEWVCTAYPHADLPDSVREEIRKQSRDSYGPGRESHSRAAELRRKAAAENPDEVIITEDVVPPVGDVIADVERLLALAEEREADGDLEPSTDAGADNGTEAPRLQLPPPDPGEVDE